MKQILFYGNCQVDAIRKTLNLGNEWKQYTIECWSTVFTKDSFDFLLKRSDVIITQPIKDGYRDKEYLSTSYILKTCSTTCKIIMFPYFILTFIFVIWFINTRMVSTLQSLHTTIIKN